LIEPTIRLPQGDRGLCAFYDLRMPTDATLGEASLWINQSKIATAQVK